MGLLAKKIRIAHVVRFVCKCQQYNRVHFMDRLLAGIFYIDILACRQKGVLWHRYSLLAGSQLIWNCRSV